MERLKRFRGSPTSTHFSIQATFTSQKSKDESLPDIHSFSGLAIEGKQDVFNVTQSNSSRTNRPMLNGTASMQSISQEDGDGPSKAVNGNHPPKVPSKNHARQIIDFRAMINQETKLPAEDGRVLSDPQEIFLENPDVRWDDIIGLDSAKRLVKEAVVYPIKYPQLFAGILSPWKGLLLYGPPGTGKTLLAKAVATECNTTFFNISASTIVSKWRGDSEKLVRVLFELARFHAPSTIFLDELDSLMSQRGSIAGACAGSSGGSGGGGGSSEHEGSRRMKTELLMQMDGLAKSEDLVFLLAASNLPWELDHAMLRRLEKRILVDLPSTEARKRMFETFLPPVINAATSNGLQLLCHVDYDKVAEITDGYSGSDIRLVCKEAAMRVVRKIFDILEGQSGTDGLLHNQIQLDPILTSDVQAAISSTMPSARQLAPKYKEWQLQYGSA